MLLKCSNLIDLELLNNMLYKISAVLCLILICKLPQYQHTWLSYHCEIDMGAADNVYTGKKEKNV